MTRIEEILVQIKKDDDSLQSLHSKTHELIEQRTRIYESLKSIDSDTNKLTGEKLKMLGKEYDSLQYQANQLNSQFKSLSLEIRRALESLARVQTSLERELAKNENVFK